MTGTGRSERPEPWLLVGWVERNAPPAIGADSRASSAGQRSRGSGDDPLAAVRDLLDCFHAAERTLRFGKLEEAMSRDGSHGGMVLARSARKQIRARMGAWLNDRPAAPPLSPHPHEEP